MLEKKVVVDRLQFNYNGAFELEEFYKTVEDWKDANGREKEIKKKLEHITQKGKNIEWTVELWRFVTAKDKFMTRVRALFKNVSEIDVKKGNINRTLNQGEVLIIFDSFLETDYHEEWIMKPWIYFLRTVFDKYIYNFWAERYVSKLRTETYDLHRTVTAFFHLYKYHGK